MYNFSELRKKYPIFEYNNYLITKNDRGYEVTYNYSIKGLDTFSTKWTFPANMEVNPEILNRLIFNLGLVEAISYWKITCSPNINICCGGLDEEQVNWWKKLFYNGLGEFMYVNHINIDSDKLVNIDSKGDNGPVLHDEIKRSGYYVPVGGGKDSIVTLELLNANKITTLSINKNTAIKNIIDLKRDQHDDCELKRTLDNKIGIYNQKGFLNGHIPFSAVVAFASYIAAYLNGIQYIALSNESSANETTVVDSFVNHQYSKSYEFECDFRLYMNTIIDSEIYYFSFLRPLNELQIASLFAQYKEYHKCFRSCNVGSKVGKWCCNCSKCLFVYIILSPFLTDAELFSIFGENLLNKESLEKYFRELTGLDPNKPFECVGTRREVLAALKKFIEAGRNSLLTDRYRDYILSTKTDISEVLHEWSNTNGLRASEERLIKEGLKN